MARLPRLALPGYPHHVIQRGNNRQMIFLTGADHQYMLSLLYEQARQFEVALHSYVLMGNHFHLLATPSTGEGLQKMMQAVGRSYVRYFNDLNGRSGTLWEGRYKSTVIQTDRYLLACMAYIDLNPVRAGLVVEPADYAWSSYPHYSGQRADRLISPHPLYWTLGNTPFSREAAYTDMVRNGLTPGQQAQLTAAVLTGWVYGDKAFVDGLQKKTHRRVQKANAGRPVKLQKAPEQP